MQTEDQQRQKGYVKWLLLTYLMLVLMALLSSAGGFFIRIFFIGAMIFGWKAIQHWMPSRTTGGNGYASQKSKQTAYREWKSQPESRPSPPPSQPAGGSDILKQAFRKFNSLAPAYKMTILVWSVVIIFFVTVFVLISTSDESDDTALAEYLRERGDAFYTSEQYDSAYYYFKAALRINPESPEVLVGYANTIYTKNYPDSSIFYYDKAIEINPYYSDAIYNKAWVYRQKKDYKASNQALEDLLEDNPDYYMARLMIGDNDYDEGNKREATRIYQEAYPYDSNNVNLNQRLGELLPSANGERYRRHAKELTQESSN